MGNAPIAPGEVVYLLTEVRAGERIHEIGTSARVFSTDGPYVALELGGGGERGTVSCPREHVALARRRPARQRSC